MVLSNASSRARLRGIPGSRRGKVPTWLACMWPATSTVSLPVRFRLLRLISKPVASNWSSSEPESEKECEFVRFSFHLDSSLQWEHGLWAGQVHHLWFILSLQIHLTGQTFSTALLAVFRFVLSGPEGRLDPLDARPVDQHLEQHEVAEVFVQPQHGGARGGVHHRQDVAKPKVKHTWNRDLQSPLHHDTKAFLAVPHDNVEVKSYWPC